MWVAFSGGSPDKRIWDSFVFCLLAPTHTGKFLSPAAATAGSFHWKEPAPSGFHCRLKARSSLGIFFGARVGLLRHQPHGPHGRLGLPRSCPLQYEKAIVGVPTLYCVSQSNSYPFTIYSFYHVCSLENPE